MITIAGFANQHPSELVEEGKLLWEKGSVKSLVQKGLVWNAELKVKKIIKASVRIENGIVTDVFCACQPGTCAHIIAVLFAVQKETNITPDVYDTALQPKTRRTDIIDERLIELVNILKLRQPENKRAEILKQELHQETFAVKKLRAVVRNKVAGERYPSFYGATGLLEEAEENFTKQQYRSVFESCQAVLSELADMNLWYNSTYEAGEKAVALLGKMLTGEKVPPAVKQEVFAWSVVACATKPHGSFRQYMIKMLGEDASDHEQDRLLLDFIDTWSGHPNVGFYRYGFPEARDAVARRVMEME